MPPFGPAGGFNDWRCIEPIGRSSGGKSDHGVGMYRGAVDHRAGRITFVENQGQIGASEHDRLGASVSKQLLAEGKGEDVWMRVRHDARLRRDASASSVRFDPL